MDATGDSAGIFCPLKVEMSKSIEVEGQFRICSNEFTKIPQGDLKVTVISLSEFKTLDDNVNDPSNPLLRRVDELLVRVSKQVSQEGE